VRLQKIFLILFSCIIFNIYSSQADDPFADTGTTTPSTTEPTQTTAAPEEEISMDVELPIIGTIKLYPFEENGQSGFKAYMPAKGKQLNWGPIKISDGTLKLIDQKPQYSAKATVFGKSATMKLKEISLPDTMGTQKKYARARFGIDFDGNQMPTIELIQGKKAILQNVDLIIEKSKPVQIVAQSNILNQPVEITFSYEKGTTDAWAEMKKVPLKEIITQVNNTPLDKTELESAKVTLKNFMSATQQPKELIIEGKADLSKTPGLEDSKGAKEVTFSAHATATKQTMQASMKQLVLPVLGTIKDATLIGNLTDAKKDVSLEGTSTISFPGIGMFDTTLNTQINNQGMELTGKIKQKVLFAGTEVNNAELKFSTLKKTLALLGHGNIKGYPADIEISKDDKDGVSARAQINKKEIRPFENVPIPNVRDITLRDPEFKFVLQNNGSIQAIMQGVVTLFGISLQGNLYVQKSASGQTTLLEMAAPQNWKLSQGIPAFAGTLFDNIQLEELYFIISSDDYEDTTRNTKFRQGVNFLSKTKLSGALAPVGQLTGTSPSSLINLQGYLAPNPLDSVFKIAIPNGVAMKQNNVSVGKLELEVAGNPIPAFSLITTMIIKPSPQDDPLNFATRIKFQPPLFAFSGTLAGVWKNPLGIKGFTIGTDVPSVPVKGIAADVEINLPTFVASQLPSSIGLAGSMMINPDKKIKMTDANGKTIEVPLFVAMAIKLPIAGGDDLVLYGELSELTLEDLAVLAKNVVGSALPVSKMPDIGMRNSKIYMVPKATTIGEFNFDRGFTLRGEMFVPGFKAYSNFTISQEGIIAQGMCSEIKWGPFLQLLRSAKETKAMKDKVELRDPKLAEYTGPIASLKLTLKDQNLYISGLMKILDLIEQDTIVSMDRDGILFDFETALGKSMYKDLKSGKDVPVLDAHVKGKSSGSLSDPQFALSIDLLNNFQAYLLEQIKQGIKSAKIQVTQAIGQALGKVETVNELNPEKVKQQVNDAQRKVNDQKEKVRALQQDIDTLQEKIKSCT
jgi:hypothetical protein